MSTQISKRRFGLKEATIHQIKEALSHHPEIESAILYGSRAKGNYRNGSDIDLTLTGCNLTYRAISQLENEIDDLLLPYSFDFSIFSHIDNPNVVDQINRVGILFYQRGSDSGEP